VDLIARVEAIAKMRSRINLTGMDAIKFLKIDVKRWPSRTLIYLDPHTMLRGAIFTTISTSTYYANDSRDIPST
jgi:hypothetical protein